MPDEAYKLDKGPLLNVGSLHILQQWICLELPDYPSETAAVNILLHQLLIFFHKKNSQYSATAGSVKM